MLFILGTCRTDQNVTFNPSCITRLLPDPTSGLPAAKPRLSLGITSAWIGSKCIANTAFRQRRSVHREILSVWGEEPARLHRGSLQSAEPSKRCRGQCILWRGTHNIGHFRH